MHIHTYSGDIFNTTLQKYLLMEDRHSTRAWMLSSSSDVNKNKKYRWHGFMIICQFVKLTVGGLKKIVYIYIYTIFLALSLVSAGNLICLACYSLKFLHLCFCNRTRINILWQRLDEIRLNIINVARSHKMGQEKNLTISQRNRHILTMAIWSWQKKKKLKYVKH